MLAACRPPRPRPRRRRWRRGPFRSARGGRRPWPAGRRPSPRGWRWRGPLPRHGRARPPRRPVPRRSPRSSRDQASERPHADSRCSGSEGERTQVLRAGEHLVALVAVAVDRALDHFETHHLPTGQPRLSRCSFHMRRASEATSIIDSPSSQNLISAPEPVNRMDSRNGRSSENRSRAERTATARRDLPIPSRSRASDVRHWFTAPRFWTVTTPVGVVTPSLGQTRGGAPTNRQIGSCLYAFSGRGRPGRRGARPRARTPRRARGPGRGWTVPGASAAPPRRS